MLVTLMLLVSAMIAYLLGSVNGAIIISRFLYGQDIRRSGSGNAGLTNFYRTYGVTGTAGVIAIDVIKGVLGAFLGGLLVGLAAPEGMELEFTDTGRVVARCWKRDVQSARPFRCPARRFWKSTAARAIWSIVKSVWQRAR